MKTKRKVASLTATIITIGSLTGVAMAQTWVTNWNDNGVNIASTSDGGAVLNVFNDNGFPASDDLFVNGSSTFSGAGFVTESGAFTHLATSNGFTEISFTLEAGYVFDKFSFVGIDGTANAPDITLTGGLSWSIQETQTPVSTIVGQTLKHDGPVIADVIGVAGLSSFIMDWTEGGGSEDDPVGYAYSVTKVPEPCSTILLGLGGLGFVLRRRQ